MLSNNSFHLHGKDSHAMDAAATSFRTSPYKQLQWMRELMQRLTDYSMQIPPDYKTISRLVIECDGQIRFTPRAKQLLKGMFGYHGININQIQTISQYEVACERIIQNIVSALPTPSNGNTSGAELEKILDEIFSESDHGI